MTQQQLIAADTSIGTFDNVPAADAAIRKLLACGFTQDELAVICPDKFKDHFKTEGPLTETEPDSEATTLAVGGAVGATLGGLVLAATILTGGVAGVMTAAVLIGGGAFAGGFGNLIISRGYEQEIDDHIREALERNEIVVGVLFRDEDNAPRRAAAERILEGGN